MQALGPLGVPVPAVLGGTDDKEPVGSAFFVMDLVEGFVPGDELPVEIDVPEGRRELANAFVDALADLHDVPIDGPALDRFRRPGRYLERQTKRFGEMWERNRTRPMPALDAVGEWVVRNLPATEELGVVHGDARPGNAIFALSSDEVEVAALLDWELAALGDPLADVGYLLATWAEPGDPDDDPLLEVSRWTRAPGFPTRAELAARYADRRNTTTADLRFYEVLALWKAVIVMEGNYRRYVEGSADNPYFERYADGLPRLADRALALTENH
jgi:aminoglycoside phosphotransferase (APT) family kinase protein